MTVKGIKYDKLQSQFQLWAYNSRGFTRHILLQTVKQLTAAGWAHLTLGCPGLLGDSRGVLDASANLYS